MWVGDLRRVGEDTQDFVDADLRAMEVVQEWQVLKQERHADVVFLPEKLTMIGHGFVG
jgi:hypothetical protein